MSFYDPPAVTAAIPAVLGRRRSGGLGAAMEKFTTLTGVAAPLPLVNVDTD